MRLRARTIADRTQSPYARTLVELLDALRFWFLLAIALYLATLVLELDPRGKMIVYGAVRVLLILQAAICGSMLIAFGLQRYAERRRATDPASVTMVSAVAFLGKLALWAIAGLLILDNAGVQVTPLVAGLGIGGAAVALASQSILSDLFASLSIVLDKPFVLGDFIIVGDMIGSVEHIGLKTTRLRSLSGEQLIFSNNDLLQSRIRNFKRMQERRIVFSIGVTYETPPEKVRAIPAMIREAIEAQQPVRFDRAHFQKYGDFALIYEAVYFVLSPAYNLYMDIQQAINLTLLERFAAEGIVFAYPTQTVYVQRSELSAGPREGE